MENRNRAYAEAIVTLAKGEDALGVVEDELLRIARTIDENPKLRETLTDIHAPLSRRLGFLESDALAAAHPATRTALATLISAQRVGGLAEIAREVAGLAAAERDRELAEVHVAFDLDTGQRERLREALERKTGKKLELKVFVDPDVVGGVRARIGDIVIDGSVARRLADVRTRLH